MEDQTVFRVGGWAAIIGGILAILVNVFFPRPSADDIGDPFVALETARTTATWELLHIGTIVVVLVLLATFYAVTKSIDDAPASAWARFGLGAVVIGTALAVAALTIEATYSRGVEALGADALAGATYVSSGLFNAWVISYFGLGAFLYGLAFVASNGYPSWLGWVTVLAGLAGLVTGFVDLAVGPTTLTLFVLFPISSGILTLVAIYLGVLLLRRASTPAPSAM